MQNPNTIRIEDAGFSTRAKNTFLKLNFKTLGDLVDLTDPELLRNPNFGRKSLTNFKEVLAKHGFVYTPVKIRITKQMREAAQLFGVTPENYAQNMLELIREGIWGVKGEKYSGTTYRYVWQPKEDNDAMATD
jgi:hypothetical protein